MGRIQVFAAIAVIWIAAAFIHLMAAATVGPTSPLFEVAANASLGGEEWGLQIYEVLAVWVPVTAVGGSALFGFVYEYRLQLLTTQ